MEDLRAHRGRGGARGVQEREQAGLVLLGPPVDAQVGEKPRPNLDDAALARVELCEVRLELAQLLLREGRVALVPVDPLGPPEVHQLHEGVEVGPGLVVGPQRHGAGPHRQGAGGRHAGAVSLGLRGTPLAELEQGRRDVLAEGHADGLRQGVALQKPLSSRTALRTLPLRREALEHVPQPPDLELAEHPRQAGDLELVQRPPVVHVELRDEVRELQARHAVTHLPQHAGHVLRADFGRVGVPLVVGDKEIEAPGDLVQLPLLEALPLPVHLHEVKELADVQLGMLGVGVEEGDLPDQLQHGRAQGLVAFAPEHVLQLRHGYAAALVHVVCPELRRVVCGLELLQPPSEDQELRELQGVLGVVVVERPGVATAHPALAQETRRQSRGVLLHVPPEDQAQRRSDRRGGNARALPGEAGEHVAHLADLAPGEPLGMPINCQEEHELYEGELPVAISVDNLKRLLDHQLVWDETDGNHQLPQLLDG
mmetsp:Transcript_56418/g.160717  ORF Transcript_56418/g.160717 Transcript_56418/m.160717 type:complete len:483 (+) Transcript_56418:542-1990(+)